MSDDPDPITDQQVDAYLDGLLEPAERAQFENRLREHPNAAAEIQLQARISASLKRLFPVEKSSQQSLSEVLKVSTASTLPSPLGMLPRARLRRATRIALVGLAAGVAWVLVTRQFRNDPVAAPFFQPRPVALIYQEVVENGFEPYYECHDDDRFAATFQRRQGQALRLAALPAGSRMLGLSYPGGLSRDTTAMLCEIDGQPVMVFVDRLAEDLPASIEHDAGRIKVHRVARNGLVFYEVSPFEAPRVIEYLVP